MALAAAGAEARRDRVGWPQQQPVGARAMAIGHDHHLVRRRGGFAGARGRRRSRSSLSAARVLVGEQRLDLGGLERGAVARDAQHALDPFGERAAHAEHHRRGLSLLVAVRHDQRAERACGLDDVGLARDDDRALERGHAREREQDVGDHRARQLAAELLRDARSQARLGCGEALDWEDCRRAHLFPHDSGGRPSLTSRAASSRSSRPGRS